jgi:hypothetical protein
VVHVVVMVMMVVVVMMVMMLHGRSHWSSRSRSSFLRDGIAGEAEREHGGGSEGLDHGKIFLWLGEPQRVGRGDKACRLNST